MIKLTFYGMVSNTGKLILSDTKLFKKFLQRHKGKEIQLVISKKQHNKTQEQLGFLHAVVVPCIADYTGYSDEEMYGILKRMYLTKNPDTSKEYVQSLTELSREEVAKFIEKCIDFAASIGVIVPKPYTKIEKTK